MLGSGTALAGEDAGRIPPIRLSFGAFSDIEALGRAWVDLEARSDASFFQSWGWIGTWLGCLPDSVSPWLLRAELATETVGLAVLCRGTKTRHGVLRSNGLFVNETGDEELDCLTIEYNGILADRRYAPEVIRAAFDFFIDHDQGWDELYFSGVDASYPGIARQSGLRVRIVGDEPCDYADLDAVRRNGGDYLGLLSNNTRSQIEIHLNKIV